jgi:hypothetical protein
MQAILHGRVNGPRSWIKQLTLSTAGVITNEFDALGRTKGIWPRKLDGPLINTNIYQYNLTRDPRVFDAQAMSLSGSDLVGIRTDDPKVLMVLFNTRIAQLGRSWEYARLGLRARIRPPPRSAGYKNGEQHYECQQLLLACYQR